MSLFPSAHAVRNSVNETAENNLDWLSNDSYKDATGSGSVAAGNKKPPADHFKEETTLKAEENGQRQRRESPNTFSREHHKKHKSKKSKRHKEGREREQDHRQSSKRRRSRSRSRSPEKEVSYRPPSFWLDDQQDPAKTVFFLDSKSDRNNLCFDSVDNKDAAFYRPLGWKCLGGSHLDPEIFRRTSGKARTKGKHGPKDRYFCHPDSAKDTDETVDMSKVVSQNQQVRDVTSGFMTEVSRKSLDQFIAIGAPKSAQSKLSELDPLNLYDKGTQQYLGIIPASNGESTTDPKPRAVLSSQLTERVASFNNHLKDNPQDIAKWLEFIKFQEELMDSVLFNQIAGKQGQLKNRDQLLVQRKLAILEKALQKNPRCLRLQLEQVEICRNHWEAEEVSKLWKQMLDDHSGEISLWRPYLMFCQSTYSSFSIPKVAALYADCIQDILKTAAEGDGRTQSAVEDNLFEIFLQLCHFWHQSGHTEKSVAAFQAMIELNIFCPTSLDTSALSGQLAFLETFWDSDEPKFGEVGSKGWNHWMHLKEKGGWQGNTNAGSTDTEDEDSLDPSSSNVQAWLVEESKRGSKQFLPWRPDPSKGETADDCEDPDRLVLFDDIGKVLFSVTSEHQKWQLILSFLEFLGVGNEAMLTTDSPCTYNYLSAVLQSTADMTGSKFAVVGERDKCTLSNSLSSWHSTWHKSCPGILHNCDDMSMGRASAESVLIGQSDKDTKVLSLFVDTAISQLLAGVSPVKGAVLRKLQLRFHLTKVTLSNEAKVRKKQVRAVQKVAKKTLSLEENRNNLALWETYALWEWGVGNLKESQRIFETALSFAGVPKTEDQIICFTRLIHTISTLKLQMVFTAARSQPRYLGQESKSVDLDSDVLQKDALNFLATLGEGIKFIPLSQYYNSDVASSRILKARKRFVELLEEAQMEYSPIVGPPQAPQSDSLVVVPSGSYLYHLCNCYAIFQYLTVSLQAAGVVYQDMLSFIDKVPLKNGGASSTSSSSQSKLDRELLTVAQVQLLSYHCMVNPVPLLPLRDILERALFRYPDNPTLLEVFLQTESRSQVVGRLRKHFHHALKTTQSPVPMFYSITSELRRQVRMRGREEDPSDTSSMETGVSYHIRSLFERAIRSRVTRHCILFWRMFLQYEVSQGNTKNAKTVFYRALQHCPWSKVLYMDMIRYFPGEAEEFIDLMIEKELRVRVPLEEIELLLSAASAD